MPTPLHFCPVSRYSQQVQTSVWVLASLALAIGLLALLAALRKPRGGAIVAVIGAALVALLAALGATILGALGLFHGTPGAIAPLALAVVALAGNLFVMLR